MNSLNYKRNIFKSIFYIFLLITLFLPVYSQKIDVYSRSFQSERSRAYDVLHYKIKLRLDEEGKTFWGKTTITLTPFKDNFRKCVLDAETFTVTSVKDEQGQSLEFNQVPHKLTVDLGKSYDYEDKLSFTVSYFARNPHPDPTKFGMSKGYDLGISFIEESSENPSLVQALSFPTGARHWYPCYDYPNDKATQEVIITVKEEYKALSNGKLVEVREDKKNQTRTYHWHITHPHPTYLSMLVAGPYEIIKDSLNSLPIHYWVYKRDAKDARRSFHKTPEIISFFNKEFGYLFPWSKYHQITIPGIGGGAECTSATLIGQATIHDQRGEKDFPSHSLVAHEAAHQWWGDLITLRDWSHTWINESFGTYFEYVFSRHDLGEKEGAINLMQKKKAYLREAHNRYLRPIVFHHWNYPNQNFDRHTYQKGASVLHMMRWILGDKPFQKTLSHFLHKHAFEPVDTHDFLTAVKEATGKNLDWFFEQWLYKPGHPVFEVNYSWNPGKKNIHLRIEQVQDTSKGIPVFKTPVVIGITTPENKSSPKIWLDEKVEEFNFPCPQKPLLVRFDKGNYLLKEVTFDKNIQELLYQLKNDDVIGRIWAASELKKFRNSSPAVESLVQSAKSDPFWAVRKEAVRTIGSFLNEKHIEFLKEKARDKNSKVRAEAISHLGNYKKEKILTFFKNRFEREDSYLAQAEILRAVGKCGDRSWIPFLKKAAELKSPRHIIKNSAQWALKQIKKD